jgi:hypothetical protein|tara:strand:+ start:34207 stop:34713 length:507 start_codon:yes stop_codon:yes gene_type:complete
MNILTLDNKAFSLNNLPEQIEEDIRFSVLDNSDPQNPDFFFIPLIFLESFSSPAIVMEINGKEISMPLDWHIAVGDSETGNDLEILPLTSINDRGFEAFVFNPLKSYKPDFADLKVTNFYNDVKWHVPKTKNGQLLSVPITEGENPLCAFFIKDVSRQIETIDYGELF